MNESKHIVLQYTGRHQQREGGVSRNLSSDTPHRDKSYAPWNSAAQREARDTLHAVAACTSLRSAAAGRTNPRGTLRSYPTIPDHATQRPQPRTNVIALTYPTMIGTITTSALVAVRSTERNLWLVAGRSTVASAVMGAWAAREGKALVPIISVSFRRDASA